MPDGLPPFPFQQDPDLITPPALPVPDVIGPGPLPPPTLAAAPVPLPPLPIVSPGIPTDLPPLPGIETVPQQPVPTAAPEATVPVQPQPVPLGELTPEQVRQRLAVPGELPPEAATVARAERGAELVGERQQLLGQQIAAAQEQYRQRQQELFAQAETDRAEQVRRQERAEAQLQQDRDRLRDLRSKRGELTTRQIAGGIAVAALQAAKAIFAGVPPSPEILANYFDRIARDEAQAIQDAAQQVAGSEDAIAGAVESQRRLEARTELARSELLQQLQVDLQQKQAQAKSDAEAIQYAQAAEMAGAAAAQSMDAARKAQDKAELERRKAMADIRLTEAKAVGAEAEAAKEMRAAMRSGRPSVEKPPADIDPELAGVYQNDPKAAERIRQRGVRDPFTGSYIRLRGGQFATERDPAAAKTVQKRLTAATNVHAILSKLIALRDKYGWEADLTKSEGWQQMQSLHGQLTAAMKNVYETGALDEGVIRLVNKLTGGDPTQLRDIQASLRSLGTGIEDEVNIALQGAMGQLDKRWTMPLPRPGEERKAAVQDLATIAGARTDLASGKTVPAADRIGAINEMYEQVISERAKVDSPTVAREKATEALVQGAETLYQQVLNTELPEITLAIQDARQAGDDKRVRDLLKSRQQVRKFADELDDLIIERSAKLKEAKPRREAIEQAFEILGTSPDRPVRPPIGRPGVE